MRIVAPVLVAALVLGPSAARAVGLPDTGLDRCYNGAALGACTSTNTGNAAPYPRQDGRFGRDAKARVGTLAKTGGGAAGFDYTKLANNGSDLAAGAALGTAATDWACTRDNITGLTWEVKVNDVTKLRHAGWTYTLYNSDGTTNGGVEGTPDTGVGVGSDNCLNAARCDTEKFVADVNTAGLCSFNTDWRLPTRRELRTLAHAGAQNPSIDTTYFPNTSASFYWSVSSYVPLPANAWSVFFGNGYTFNIGKSSSNFVRLVRGTQF